MTAVASVGEAGRRTPTSGRGTFAAIRAGTRTAISDPGLWLLGALSFCVRGGVLVILLPVLWVPSPVLLSIYLGRFITTSGISRDAVPVAISVVVAVVLALVAALLLAGYAQIASFERICASPQTAALRRDRRTRALTARGRIGLVVALTSLQLAGLVPAFLLLPGIGQRISDAALAELQLPTSTDTPLMIAILQRVQDDLLLLAGVVLVMDLLVSVLGHRLIAGRLGVAAPSRFGIVRQSLRVLILGPLAWLVTIGAVAVTIGVSMLVWNLLRAVLFQGPTDVPVQAELVFIGQLLAVAVFGAIWVAGVTLVGVASSLRGALWTTNALH